MSSQTNKLEPVADDTNKRTRVLLVDANPFITRTFEFVLKTLPEFIVVGIVNDKLAVLDMAKVHQPDIILLDTSLLLVKQLHLILPDTHIIALTGMYTTPECLLEILEAGAASTLSKVGTFRDFVQCLHSIQNTALE